MNLPQIHVSNKATAKLSQLSGFIMFAGLIVARSKGWLPLGATSEIIQLAVEAGLLVAPSALIRTSKKEKK